MRFCFIIEEQYRDKRMPMSVVEQLRQWGHTADTLEPGVTITNLDSLDKKYYDAYILKTVSDGPGLSILEAAEAIGIPAINNSRSIRLVRNKAVAMAFAHAQGLPTPPTYFAAKAQLLSQVPASNYPLVVKPVNGSSGRGIYQVNSPLELEELDLAECHDSFLLAQQYMENTGFDIKLYVTGKEVFSVTKRSPLHPEVPVTRCLIPITLELRNLALQVGSIFGLDIYGLDIVETPHGVVIVDINDFPSFGLVPRAVVRISHHIIRIAKQLVEPHRTVSLAATDRYSVFPSNNRFSMAQSGLHGKIRALRIK